MESELRRRHSSGGKRRGTQSTKGSRWWVFISPGGPTRVPFLSLRETRRLIASLRCDNDPQNPTHPTLLANAVALALHTGKTQAQADELLAYVRSFAPAP